MAEIPNRPELTTSKPYIQMVQELRAQKLSQQKQTTVERQLVSRQNIILTGLSRIMTNINRSLITTNKTQTSSLKEQKTVVKQNKEILTSLKTISSSILKTITKTAAATATTIKGVAGKGMDIASSSLVTSALKAMVVGGLGTLIGKSIYDEMDPSVQKQLKGSMGGLFSDMFDGIKNMVNKMITSILKSFNALVIGIQNTFKNISIDFPFFKSLQSDVTSFGTVLGKMTEKMDSLYAVLEKISNWDFEASGLYKALVGLSIIPLGYGIKRGGTAVGKGLEKLAEAKTGTAKVAEIARKETLEKAVKSGGTSKIMQFFGQSISNVSKFTGYGLIASGVADIAVGNMEKEMEEKGITSESSAERKDKYVRMITSLKKAELEGDLKNKSYQHILSYYYKGVKEKAASIEIGDVVIITDQFHYVFAGTDRQGNILPPIRIPANENPTKIKEIYKKYIVEQWKKISGVQIKTTEVPAVKPEQVKKVIRDLPRQTYVELGSGKKEMREGDVSYRANNPGNILYGDFAKSMGAIGYITAKGNKKVAVFPDVETGTKALENLVSNTNYRDISSVEEFVNRYVGKDASQAERSAYAAALKKAVPDFKGYGKLSVEDKRTFLSALIAQEGNMKGLALPFSDTMLASDTETGQEPRTTGDKQRDYRLLALRNKQGEEITLTFDSLISTLKDLDFTMHEDIVQRQAEQKAEKDKERLAALVTNNPIARMLTGFSSTFAAYSDPKKLINEAAEALELQGKIMQASSPVGGDVNINQGGSTTIIQGPAGGGMRPARPATDYRNDFWSLAGNQMLG